jgi:flagellin
LNIADGALNEEANILQRMRELVIQAMNDSYSSIERGYMGQEFTALRDELDRIAAATNFNTMQIFAAPSTTDGTAIYGADATGEPPRKTIDAGSINPADPLFGADDFTSGHHFNMMIGANSSAEDVAAYDGTFNYYGNDAANMITIQFGQMDANGIFSLDPAYTQARNLFDGFGWNIGVGADTEDNRIALGAFQTGEATGSPLNATVRSKLRLLLQIIDGSHDIAPLMKARVFSNITQNGTFTTGLSRINEMRARIGALTNRLEHSISNTINQVNNTQAAESLVRDADFAQETARFTKNQILSQSATAMLAQANSQPNMILELLQ